MKYSVRVLGRAVADLRAIRDYVAFDASEAADELVESLIAAIESLDTLPDRGSVPRESRLRRLGYRYQACGPYLIFYKVLRRQVRVYRVLHGRRAYEDLL